MSVQANAIGPQIERASKKIEQQGVGKPQFTVDQLRAFKPILSFLNAKDRDILRQFLIEALLMSGLGGLLGVVAGVGGAKIVEDAVEYPTLLQPSSILLALSFSAAVGIFFGYYPARRAAMLDPIEALRYE